jgi:predicted nucleic acid-binding protein
MIVVADASPLNYLIQVEADILLQKLFGQVFVPTAVIAELGHPAAPQSVATWLLRVPPWIEIWTPQKREDPALQRLDPGEREAILLAQEQQAELLLIDERLGRAEARRRGISTTGTLGVLLIAGERKLVDALSIFRRLIDETSFRVTPDVSEYFNRRLQDLFKRAEE